MLISMGLPHSGTKQELIQRLTQPLNHGSNSQVIPRKTQESRHIPHALRACVFTTYIKDMNTAQCYVGCGARISPFNFECGHVVAVANGGKTVLDNLRPICGSCNKSMQTTNLFDFINMNGFKCPYK